MTTSAVDLTEVHGRDKDKARIVNLMLSQSSQQEVIPIISIVGMAGIGKTTLARIAFNDDKVKAHFDRKIWVCVSEPFDEMRIAKDILESLTNNEPNLASLETVMQKIRQHIEGKKFLLVLDDVWTENPKNWDQLKCSLKCGSQKSRILVTTRKEDVANVIGSTNIISLGTLPKEKCWSLFSQVAFHGRTDKECEHLKEIGTKIVQRCKGLPLAVKTLASLLRFKRKFDEWQNVLDSEIWEIKEIEQGLCPPLLLSYHDLPPMLKKCFAYCAIFPKNYEIKKDMLIKLWMAQDYLRSERNKDMELVGEEYFQTLAVRSFFQDFERNAFDDIISCKMHDIIRDFAHFLTRNECHTMEVDGTQEFELESSYKNVRHSMIMFQSEASSFPSSIYTEKSLLRSLVVEFKYHIEPYMVCTKLFDELTCLRSLVLSRCSIEEVPIKIEKLIHLRHLDLSDNRKIEELPETLCRLYNLQTLDIRMCINIKKLPQGIGNLINLRHLLNFGTSTSYMPKGFQQLTSLRTLDIFVISYVGNGSKSCSLECLKNFKHLREIRINGLGNVMIDEVKDVRIFLKMKNLRILFLNFEGRNRMNEEHELLAQVLEPPPDLETLWINNYRGNIFPNWIMSLTQLRSLGLENCINCKHLPPLGSLLSLERLNIWGLKSVKRMGDEFRAIKSGATSSSSVIAFPKLKFLCLIVMAVGEWEEWNYNMTQPEEMDMPLMPHVQTVRIWKYPESKFQRHQLDNITTFEECIRGRTWIDELEAWEACKYEITKWEEKDMIVMPHLRKSMPDHLRQMTKLSKEMDRVTRFRQPVFRHHGLGEDI